MYSGGESTDSQKCTQWAMNPAAYQNTSNDLVDWAALAQQWIIMKEAGPPPIPGQRQLEKSQEVNEDSQEGGEAEMDMDDKDEAPSWNSPERSEAPPAPGAEAWTNWNPPSTGQNWNWNNSWNPPSAVPPPLIAPVKAPLLPTPNNTYSPSDGASDNAVPYGGYNTTSQTSSNFTSQQQPAFWTGMAVGKVTQTEIKPHNKRYSKVNVPTKVTIITPAAVGTSKVLPPLIPEEPVVATPTLDANKRKQLPAWIREGLEKMERDKLKELEKEKEKQVRDEYTEKMKLEELEKMEILKTTMKEKNLLRKSRFDSDNENSDDQEHVKKKAVSPTPPVPLTPEELMLKVRKTMTEILLKVTNQLIEQTCKEERQRYLKKRRASNQLASAPSGAIIKAKLGLGAYDEGSSSNEDSDNDDRQEDSSDSEADLRESIRKRQAAFSKTEQQIENRLAEAERKKDGSRSPSRSRSSSRDSHDSKSQVEANGQEVNPRYSDDDKSPKKKRAKDDNNSSSSSTKSRRISSSRSDSRSKSRSRSESPPRSRKRRHSRSLSSRRGRSRDRSASYNRRESIDSKKRSRRSRSDSKYSKRSRRSRSHSYSSRKSSKRSHYSSRRSRTRSRSRDRKYSSKKLYESNSKRSKRSRSYDRSRRRSISSTRSPRKSRSKRSSSRRRRSSRSSSRGKRSRRR